MKSKYSLAWRSLRACWAAGVLALAVRAQSDQSVYTDSLVNGWESWSWAAVDFGASTPVHSGTRSASVAADAWEALYLHHAAFDTTGYTEFEFWIHGGTVGGQLLRVQALRNGAAQTAVNLAPLAANSWQKITLSLASLGVAAKSDLDGFWIQERSGTTKPAFYVDDVKLLGVPAPAVVSIAINAGQVLGPIDPRLFGLNAAVWDADFDTPTTVSLLAEIGNQALRFPGGSLSDEYHWQSNNSGNNTWQWATSFDEFTHVATNTGAKVIITVNYGTGTPTEAAEWVRYANVTKGYRIPYWEVGNENYGGWESDANARAHDPYTYAFRFEDYYNQMKAIDSTIRIGAVVITGENSYANYSDHPVTNPRTGQVHHGWTPVMLATLHGLGVTPDFVVYHRYAQGPGNESDASLLSSASTWAADATDLRQQVNDYLGAAGSGVELVCTENNSAYSGPGKQTTSLVNGLFLADSIGAAMQTEFRGVMWWDLRNGQETGNNNSASLYGWRPYGDYGIVNRVVPAGPADRYPTFYIAKLLRNFARGGDVSVSARSDYQRLAAYAARRADGSLSILIINKSPTATLNANLTLSGHVPDGALNVWSYGIPQDEAARTGVGSADLMSTSAVGISTNFNRAFPPYSATVLSLPGTPPPVIVHKPDNQIKTSSETAYLGNNIYNATGVGQAKSQSTTASLSATFHLQIQNDGSVTDSFRVRGTGSTTGFSVRYYTGTSGGSDITAAVIAGSYLVNSLPVGASRTLRMTVTVAKGTTLNTVREYLVTTTSTVDPNRSDTVKAWVTAK